MPDAYKSNNCSLYKPTSSKLYHKTHNLFILPTATDVVNIVLELALPPMDYANSIGKF